MSKTPAKLMGFPVVETDDMPSGTITLGVMAPHTERAQALRDEAAAFARTIAPSTPVREALALLVKAHLLTEEESASLLLPAVWTWGDVPVILGRGEITNKELEGKVRELLGRYSTDISAAWDVNEHTVSFEVRSSHLSDVGE